MNVSHSTPKRDYSPGKPERRMRLKKATRGPLSTIAATAAKTREMFGVGSQIRNAGIDNAARALHQCGEACMPRRFALDLEYEPQPFLDEILELARP
jgi:hypothetical protein